MKKFKTLLTLLLTSVTLAGCDVLTDFLNKQKIDDPLKTDPIVDNKDDDVGTGDDTQTVDYKGGTLAIVTFNDLHGAIEENSEDDLPGIAKLATRINAVRETYGTDNTVVICAGDAFQGQMISNMSYGLSVVNCLNTIGIDQMCVGNHEFDWGIEKITQYFDGNYANGEANFPLSASNIKLKSNGNGLDYTQDYTIVNKPNGLKIGIVGGIGYGLEYDILRSKVKDYEFKDPVTIAKPIIKKLRTEEKCDVVICNYHDDGKDSGLNESFASLVGDYKVDAVINGHSHEAFNGAISRGSGNVSMPYVEAACNGKNYGLITLTLTSKKNVVKQSSQTAYVGTYTSDYPSTYAVLQEEINNEAYKEASTRKLGLMGESAPYKSYLYNWVGSVISSSFSDCDIGIINQGGLRVCDIYNGEWFTYKDLYSLIPFDNMLMKCQVKGSTLKTFISNHAYNIYSYSDSLESISNIQNQVMYTVYAIDYVAENSSSTFYSYKYEATGICMRDLLCLDILKQQEDFNDFRPVTRLSVLTPEYVEANI